MLAMGVVYKAKLYRYYSAPGLSWPLLFVIASHLLALAFAFLLAYFAQCTRPPRHIRPRPLSRDAPAALYR